ncbi:MAG: DNA polymerase IV [bacterium]|nr:DNA polymerase IV [bacterium]
MPDRPRAIVHIDLDAFYAAVEVLENPDLAGKPVLIGGRGRGVVAAASYPARTFGIRSAMPMFKALERCPQAIVLPPRFSLYRDYSRQVMEILHQASPLVEQISIDEAYLDLTDQVTAWEESVEIASSLQARVIDDVGLSASLGVATNKLVAKVASDHDKPGGLTVVQPGAEAAFLALYLAVQDKCSAAGAITVGCGTKDSGETGQDRNHDGQRTGAATQGRTESAFWQTWKRDGPAGAGS